MSYLKLIALRENLKRFAQMKQSKSEVVGFFNKIKKKLKCGVDIKDFLIWVANVLTQKKSLVFQAPGFFGISFT